MATKTKSVKTKTAHPDQLKQEKEETVEVKQLLKDERTHKIAGSILILTAILLFVAFSSYLFTWAEDQDKFSYRMLLANDIKVQNLLGTFGAFVSEIFIRKGFGIASYLICTFFFVIGVNLFFGKKVFSVSRNIKYLIVGLPVICVATAVIFSGKAFPWGGAAGDMIKDWMYKTVGQNVIARKAAVELSVQVGPTARPHFNVECDVNFHLMSFRELLKPCVHPPLTPFNDCSPCPQQGSQNDAAHERHFGFVITQVGKLPGAEADRSAALPWTPQDLTRH